MGNSEIACGVPQEEFCCMDTPLSLSLLLLLLLLIYAIAQDILSLEVLA
jgi:hypothetical protein